MTQIQKKREGSRFSVLEENLVEALKTNKEICEAIPEQEQVCQEDIKELPLVEDENRGFGSEYFPSVNLGANSQQTPT